MKFLSKMNRALSLILVFVLILGLMPVSASAADASRVADTIFFATDRHEESSKLNSLLKALAYEPGLVVLGGDHVNNTNSGSLASITSEIQSVYPGVQTFYTYAAHDPNVSPDSSNPYAYARTGEYYEGEDYYVYGVDQNDMQNSSSAATASANFKSWAAGRDDGKVIFVMCHMPIHQRRNDNAGGATWMNALNEAGQTHDIVFLWGHNHTGENTTDKNVYFVTRGGSLTPQGGSTGTINFTYMNAGYIKNGYASMVVVNDDTVSVTRYNTSGTATNSYTIQRLFAGHTHSWSVSSTVAATCEVDGTVIYSCSGCAETNTETIPATGHTYECVTTDATCGAEGSKVYTCTACGDSYTETIPATENHSYESVTVDATCTEAGSVTHTCTVCGHSYVESVAALGHSYESVTTAPSCTEDGCTTYTCATCGHSYTDGITAALGHDYDSVITATCEENGYVVYTCAVCGHSYNGETVAAYGHSYETTTVAPTCATLGYTTYVCASCGHTYTGDEVAALGHAYESVTLEPTCTEAGSTTYTCTVCGHSYVDGEVPALGHDYESVVTEPTFETEGYTTHTCQVCGDVKVDSFVPVLSHDYESVTVDATCTEDGYTTYTCVTCGYTYTDVLPALGHSFTTVTTDATCTEHGSTVHTCSACGYEETDVIPATGHSFETTVIEPSCTNAGYTTDTCACGHVVTQEIPALGHSYESKYTAPTCTVTGGTTYTCTSCGDSYIEAEAALGHSYTAESVAPTCTTAGYTTYTCAACGDTYTADETAALGHSYNSLVTDPTCTEAGFTTYTCAVCDHSYTGNETAALGHSYTCVESDGYLVYTCDACGHSYSEKFALTYTKVSSITDDNNYVITLYSGSKYYALSHENNKISVVQVTMSNNEITSEITEDMVWHYENKKLSYEQDGTTYYLYAQSSSGWWGWFSAPTLTLSTSNSTDVTFSSSKLKVGSYYLRYSSSKVSLNRSATTTYFFIEG